MELFTWDDPNAITDDGGVKYYTETEGEGWKKPRENWEVLVHVRTESPEVRPRGAMGWRALSEQG